MVHAAERTDSPSSGPFMLRLSRLEDMMKSGPGLRPHDGKSDYAALVIDPDGHKLEAVHQ